MDRSIVLLAGLILTSADAWAAPRTLLPAESRVEFTVKQMGVPMSGEFKRFQATIDFDPARLETSSADLRIEAGSVDTGNEEVDGVAVNPDWLDKAHAPYATFKSTSIIRALGKERYEAAGVLKIRDKARNITVQFTRTEQAGGKTILTGEFIIKRSEFGIGGGEWNEEGVVADEVPVKVRFTLAPPGTARDTPAPR